MFAYELDYITNLLKITRGGLNNKEAKICLGGKKSDFTTFRKQS